MSLLWSRAYNLATYFSRRRKNWRRECGCEFRATALGWLGIKCMEHWLD